MSIVFDERMIEGTRFGDFLREVLPEDDKRDVMQQWAGYLMVPSNYQRRHMILLSRDGLGKTSLMQALIKMVVGWDRTAHLRHETGSVHPDFLRFRHLAVMHDLPERCRFSEDLVSLLREITFEQFPHVNIKYRPPEQIVYPTRLMVESIWDPPIMPCDLGSAFIVCEFNTIPEPIEQPDYMMMDMEKHSDQVYDWALYGLARVMTDGFRVPPEMEYNNYEIVGV